MKVMLTKPFHTFFFFFFFLSEVGVGVFVVAPGKLYVPTQLDCQVQHLIIAAFFFFFSVLRNFFSHFNQAMLG